MAVVESLGRVVLLVLVVLLRPAYLDVDGATGRLSGHLQHVRHVLGAERDVEQLCALQLAVFLDFALRNQHDVCVNTAYVLA